MFYLGTIAVLSLAGLIVVSQAEWWSSVFFFRNYLSPNWIARGWGGYTIHYWSLAVEEQFYLLWPAALVFLGKGRARWFALSLAMAVAGWRIWDLHYHWFDRLVPGLLFGSRTDVRLDALLFGCLAALLLDEDSVRAAFSHVFKLWMWWVCLGAYCGIQILYLMQGARTYSIFESILLPLLVVGTVYRPQTWVGWVLETRPLKWVGRLSYSLYLWQQLFSVPTVGSSILLLQRFPIGISMIVLCAWISYRFVERPFIRWGHRLAPPPTEGREDLGSRP